MTYVSDIREQAQQAMDPASWNYLERGAGEGHTRSAASAAWQRIALRPRILRGVASVDTRTHALGCAISVPVLTGPTGRATRFCAEGELAVAQAVRATGGAAILPSSMAPSFAALRVREPEAILWQQLYPMADRDRARDLLAGLRGAGCSAVVLTVDLLPAGDATLPPLAPAEWEVAASPAGRSMFVAATLDDLAWLCAEAGMPVAVKGVLHPGDAAECIAAGASALIVSNHGGNQMDTVLSTADALSDIVAAAAGREVYVDGGIRDGASVFKALALGARGVLVGRPTAYALASGGSHGVRDLLRFFARDLERTMALCGAADIAAIDPMMIVPSAS